MIYTLTSNGSRLAHGVTTIAWMAHAIHPLCHQRMAEMATIVLYLQNNLMAAP
jgi:hypothetical protein